MRVAQKTVNPERLSKDATAIRGINNMLETVSDDMIIDSDKHFDWQNGKIDYDVNVALGRSR